MKTTLMIDDGTFGELRETAARDGKTISELVEAAIRLLLGQRASRVALPPLPSYKTGGALVDVADRDALYQAMEGR